MVDSVLIESGDDADAELVDSMFGHPALVDYVHPDEQFSVSNLNPGDGEFDVSSGKAYIGIDSLTDNSGEVMRQAMVAVQKDAEQNVSIQTVDGMNYVWLDAQIGVGDSPAWVVTDTVSPPSAASVHVATLEAADTNDDSQAESLELVEYVNRAPDLYAELITHPDSDFKLDVEAGSMEGMNHVDSSVLTGTPLGSTEPKFQSYKSDFSWADINWEDKGESLVDNPDASGIIAYPTLIHAESVFDNPIDTWYLYQSSHDYNDTYLHTAPSAWGPFTFYGSVFSDPEGSQTASPSAVFDPKENRLNLYYHVTVSHPDAIEQPNKLATAPASGDGTNFTIQGKVLRGTKDGTWDEFERQYLRVTRWHNMFIGCYQGRDGDEQNRHAIGLCHSYDGEQFVKTQSYPAFDNAHWQLDYYESNQGHGIAPTISTFSGQPMIHYTSDRADVDGDGDFDGVCRVLPYSMADSAIFQPGEIMYRAEQTGWLNDDTLVVSEFQKDKNYVYMYYHGNRASDDTRKIGVARAPLEDFQ